MIVLFNIPCPSMPYYVAHCLMMNWILEEGGAGACEYDPHISFSFATFFVCGIVSSEPSIFWCSKTWVTHIAFWKGVTLTARYNRALCEMTQLGKNQLKVSDMNVRTVFGLIRESRFQIWTFPLPRWMTNDSSIHYNFDSDINRPYEAAACRANLIKFQSAWRKVCHKNLGFVQRVVAGILCTWWVSSKRPMLEFA